MTATVSEAIARLTGPAEVVADLSWPGTTATVRLLRRFHEADPPQTITEFGRQRAAYLRAQLTGPTHPLSTTELDFALAAIDQLETLPRRSPSPPTWTSPPATSSPTPTNAGDCGSP